MKDIFPYYAAYNKSVNGKLLSILENIPKENIFRQTGAYYSTIFDVLNHIFFSNDLFFLKLFDDVFPESSYLNGRRFARMDEAAYRKLMEELNEDYIKFFSYRKEMDDMICYFMEALDEEKLRQSVESYNSAREPVQCELWKVFLQLFNHQTHHRGQISAFLDQFDVENDYSSFV